MLEGQVLVLLLLFLMLLFVIGLQFTVMLGNKDQKRIPVLFFVVGSVLQELIHASEIPEADIQTLEQDEEG